MTNSERKGKQIRQAYLKLKAEGVKKRDRVRILSDRYFLTERQIYNHVKVKELKNLKTA